MKEHKHIARAKATPDPKPEVLKIEGDWRERRAEVAGGEETGDRLAEVTAITSSPRVKSILP